MENTQVDAASLLQEGMNIAADLTKRCMILAGQNSILAQQIEELKKKKQEDNVVQIKT